jgi:hypothetical protein
MSEMFVDGRDDGPWVKAKDAEAAVAAARLEGRKMAIEENLPIWETDVAAARAEGPKVGYHSQRCQHCDHIRAAHALTASGCLGHALPGRPGAECPCSEFEGDSRMSKHLPECPCDISLSQFCICDRLRTAEQRGYKRGMDVNYDGNIKAAFADGLEAALEVISPWADLGPAGAQAYLDVAKLLEGKP